MLVMEAEDTRVFVLALRVIVVEIGAAVGDDDINDKGETE